MTELYILTDAGGYTVACHPSRKALALEASRRPLLAPIRAWHWTCNHAREWVLKDEWVWEGAPF